jgi:hypothetical protein
MIEFDLPPYLPEPPPAAAMKPTDGERYFDLLRADKHRR